MAYRAVWLVVWATVWIIGLIGLAFVVLARLGFEGIRALVCLLGLALAAHATTGPKSITSEAWARENQLMDQVARERTLTDRALTIAEKSLTLHQYADGSGGWQHAALTPPQRAIQPAQAVKAPSGQGQTRGQLRTSSGTPRK